MLWSKPLLHCGPWFSHLQNEGIGWNDPTGAFKFWRKYGHNSQLHSRDNRERSQQPLKEFKHLLSKVKVKKQQGELGPFLMHWFHLTGLRGNQATSGQPSPPINSQGYKRADFRNPIRAQQLATTWPKSSRMGSAHHVKDRSPASFSGTFTMGSPILPVPPHPPPLLYNQKAPGFENHFTTQHLKLIKTKIWKSLWCVSLEQDSLNKIPPQL